MNLNETLTALRATVAPLFPRHRRWKQFLRDLPLDPDRLPRAVAAPTARDFIICGSPRTGTTLLCATLFQPPAVITVMEPWDGMRLPPAELFASIRAEIEATGKLGQGKLDVETLLEKGVIRWCQEREATHEVVVNPGYLLGIKWPAFWRYLEALPETKFLICLRHPVEVINSFKKVGGRLAQGLEYDIAFNRRLNQELQSTTHDVAIRRILLYDYINSRLLPYLSGSNVFVVRYERWFSEPEQLLSELSAFLGVQLSPGPANIRPPRGHSELRPDEMALIRQHCQTTELLGYHLNCEPEQSQGRVA